MPYITDSEGESHWVEPEAAEPTYGRGFQDPMNAALDYQRSGAQGFIPIGGTQDLAYWNGKILQFVEGTPADYVSAG